MAAQTQRYDVGVGVLKQVGGHDYDVPLRALKDVAIYAGFPAALNGISAAKEVDCNR